jgi:intracellular septation protein
MKFLFDLFPVILFFAAFKLYDVYTATSVVIAATVAQIGWVRWKHGKVDTMLWVSLALVAVFGGATLIFRDDTFIRWKPTVLYWLFASVLLISATVFKRNLIQRMLEQQAQMQLPPDVWPRLNLAWVGFFGFMGVLNLAIAFYNPLCTSDADCLSQWVTFKLFGGMGLMLLFVILQGLFLAKYVQEENS